MNCIKGLLWGLLLCLALTLLCGCKTKYVAVPETHYKDSIVTRWRTDSVFQHDSVYIKEYAVGDTVYQFRDRTKMLYRDRIQRDTVQVVVRDTVTCVYPNAARDDTDGFDARPLLIIIGGLMCCVPIAVWLVKRRRT